MLDLMWVDIIIQIILIQMMTFLEQVWHMQIFDSQEIGLPVLMHWTGSLYVDILFNTHMYKVFATRKEPGGGGEKTPQKKINLQYLGSLMSDWNFHSL